MAPPKTAKSTTKLELLYPEQLSNIYSNHVQCYVSNWDVVFDFGVVSPEMVGPKATITTRITMSPSHAKQFASLLNQNIAKYEEVFGVINVTPKKG